MDLFLFCAFNYHRMIFYCIVWGHRFVAIVLLLFFFLNQFLPEGSVLTFIEFGLPWRVSCAFIKDISTIVLELHACRPPWPCRNGVGGRISFHSGVSQCIRRGRGIIAGLPLGPETLFYRWRRVCWLCCEFREAGWGEALGRNIIHHLALTEKNKLNKEGWPLREEGKPSCSPMWLSGTCPPAHSDRVYLWGHVSGLKWSSISHLIWAPVNPVHRSISVMMTMIQWYYYVSPKMKPSRTVSSNVFLEQKLI